MYQWYQWYQWSQQSLILSCLLIPSVSCSSSEISDDSRTGYLLPFFYPHLKMTHLRGTSRCRWYCYSSALTTSVYYQPAGFSLSQSVQDEIFLLSSLCERLLNGGTKYCSAILHLALSSWQELVMSLCLP